MRMSLQFSSPFGSKASFDCRKLDKTGRGKKKVQMRLSAQHSFKAFASFLLAWLDCREKMACWERKLVLTQSTWLMKHARSGWANHGSQLSILILYLFRNYLLYLSSKLLFFKKKYLVDFLPFHSRKRNKAHNSLFRLNHWYKPIL